MGLLGNLARSCPGVSPQHHHIHALPEMYPLGPRSSALRPLGRTRPTSIPHGPVQSSSYLTQVKRGYLLPKMARLHLLGHNGACWRPPALATHALPPFGSVFQPGLVGPCPLKGPPGTGESMFRFPPGPPPSLPPLCLHACLPTGNMIST